MMQEKLYEAIHKVLLREEAHPMIYVDGEMKHRHNSLGQPIHATDEGIKNFHRWFGKSKTVDEHGRPIVFYHGGGADIAEFSHKFVGAGNDQYGSGFYFTDKPDVASGYALDADNAPNVVPVYLRVSKPLTPTEPASLSKTHISRIISSAPDLDDALTNFGDVSHEGHARVMKSAVDSYVDHSKFNAMNYLHNDFYNGHAGTFLTKFKKITGHDAVVVDQGKGNKTIVSMFDPSDIKSATGNNGSFSHPTKLTERTHNKIKYDQIAEAYIAALKLQQDDIPVVDISHHRDILALTEANINDWIGDGNHSNNTKFDSVDDVNREFLNTKPMWFYKNPHRQLSDEHRSNINRDHSDALDAYMIGGFVSGEKTGSRSVNNHLIEAHKNKTPIQKVFEFKRHPNSLTPEFTLNLDHLDDALKQNTLKEPLTTYSGVGFNPAHIMKNDLLHLPSYTSSSTNKVVATAFAQPQGTDRHVIEIEHPTGSTGFYIGNYRAFTLCEHVMPRGVTLKINPEPTIYEDSQGKKLHVWKAKRLISLEK